MGIPDFSGTREKVYRCRNSPEDMPSLLRMRSTSQGVRMMFTSRQQLVKQGSSGWQRNLKRLFRVSFS